MLDWASNHINEVARAARASSTLIARQRLNTPNNNTTSEEDIDSDDDDGKTSQRRSVVLSRHSNYNKSNQASRSKCMKFDSVKNFLDN